MHRMNDFRFEIPGQRLGEDDQPALRVEARDVGDTVTVVEVRGDLDTMSAPGFEQWVRDRFTGRSDVVVDLDGVGFLASAGIAALMGLRQEADRRGMRVHLTGRDNHAVSRPVEVVGLQARLDLKADAHAVVAELVPAH
jgi:anti-sigma B factor antagonist